MNDAERDARARELFDALRACRAVEPLTERWPALTLTEAYHISERMLALRCAEGERVVGRKIGLTGRAVQEMLGIDQPDFGHLTDVMHIEGETMAISGALIAPKAEAELAFILKRPLRGPGVSAEDVLDATESVAPCFEVVDSRVRDWAIKIQDTVADNASSGLFVLGDARIDPRAVDLASVRATVYKNGAQISEGTGRASDIGSPEGCVAWLANVMSTFGVGLEAGEIILSGALVPLEPVQAGDVLEADITGVGSVRVTFV